VVYVDLTVTPDNLPLELSLCRPESLAMERAAPVRSMWLTRRCAVGRVEVRPVGLADACMLWQAWADMLITNRVRWLYWVTIRSENPGDAADLWPTVSRSRAASVPGLGDSGADGSTPGLPQQGGIGSSVSTDGSDGTVRYGWASGRRGSVFGAHRAPARYRKLLRTRRAPGEVPAPTQRLVETAMLNAADAESFCRQLTRRDSFENIDVDAEAVPIMSHWHKDAEGSSGDGVAAAPSSDVFDVVDLGRNPAGHSDAIVRASAACACQRLGGC
jgi:hypothetical protein